MKKKTRKGFKKSNVYDYWKDYMITSQGKICHSENMKTLSKIGISSIDVVHDWGECRCFACNGLMEKEEIDEIYGDECRNNSKLVWDKNSMFMEVAHIIPFAVDDEDIKTEIVENRFLLCKECHKLAPDTTYRQAFFIWVYNRRVLNNINLNIESLRLAISLDWGELPNFELIIPPSQSYSQTKIVSMANKWMKNINKVFKFGTLEYDVAENEIKKICKAQLNTLRIKRDGIIKKIDSESEIIIPKSANVQ